MNDILMIPGQFELKNVRVSPPRRRCASFQNAWKRPRKPPEH